MTMQHQFTQNSRVDVVKPSIESAWLQNRSQSLFLNVVEPLRFDSHFLTHLDIHSKTQVLTSDRLRACIRRPRRPATCTISQPVTT